MLDGLFPLLFESNLFVAGVLFDGPQLGVMALLHLALQVLLQPLLVYCVVVLNR